MLNNNELYNISNNKMEPKNIKILNVIQANTYFFLELDNGQKILTNGNELYDVSDYNYLIDIFYMGNKLCAVMEKGFTTCVVDLNTMEILFQDKVWRLFREDNRTLKIIKEIGCGNAFIYDIETKSYLSLPANYEFEKSLGNNLYVFKEQHNLETDFCDYKKCVINADGKVVMKDIDGYVESSDNYIIITKKNKLYIVKINEDLSFDIDSIEQNEKIIADPVYHDGNIIVIEKGLINIYKPNLNLIKQFEIKELESVLQYEIVSDTLKILLPYSINEEKINKHIFINLKTGKKILHLRIDGYPYWTPQVYVGKDNCNEDKSFEYGKVYEPTEYHFYDSNFNKTINVKGNYYLEIDDTIFEVGMWNGQGYERKFVNAKTGVEKKYNYDIIQFLPEYPYGYAFNTVTNMIDIIDKDWNTIIPNIDYKQLGLNKENTCFHNFTFFVVNDYVCIIKHIPNGPQSLFRFIIQNSSGEIVLDSMKHRCYPMGNMIQIENHGKSEFLNTLTGEIGQLSILTSTNKEGKIDFNRISDVKNIFQIEDRENSSLEIQTSKVKKIVHKHKKV